MNDIIVEKIGIDKLSCTRKVEDNELLKAITPIINDEVEDLTTGVTFSRKPKEKVREYRIYHVPKGGGILKNSPFLLLQLNFSQNYIRIEYNPNKATQGLYDDLDLFFTMITGHDFFTFLAGCKVTRIDLNIDIPGLALGDVLFKPKKSQTFSNYIGRDGAETMYAGKSKNNQMRIYDKEKESPGINNGQPLLRIEPSWKPMVLVPNLPNMDNPFKRVELLNLMPEKYPKDIHPGHWSAFTDSVRYCGNINTALKRQPQDVRGKFKYALSKNQVDWWNPDQIWDELWLEALKHHRLLDLPSPKPLTLAAGGGESKGWGDDFADHAA